VSPARAALATLRVRVERLEWCEATLQIMIVRIRMWNAREAAAKERDATE
jgi:hypothetical protein